IGAGPPALDVVDAEVVEPLGDAQLVLEREGDVLRLRAVAQRRVVELDGSHGRGPPMKASCRARTASSVYFSSTTTETLISDVELICTSMPSAPSTPKSRAATPGRSGTRRIVSLASSRSYATPATDTSSMRESSSTTQVPGAPLNVDRTWTGTR